EFCDTNYHVEFPLFEKIDVNGAQQHPIFAELEQTADADGEAGDVKWNFEKFLVSPEGKVVARFRPQVTPDDPALVEAIDAQPPSGGRTHEPGLPHRRDGDDRLEHRRTTRRAR